MAITFKRDFIIGQLNKLISGEKDKVVVDENVQYEIDRQTNYREQTRTARDAFVKALSEVDYKKGKAADVRRAVGAILGQYGGAARDLMSELPSDETIRNNAINAYSRPRQDTANLKYKRALETLTASNTENVSYSDLKTLGITGIESYGVKAIEPATQPDADGVTPHTEE